MRPEAVLCYQLERYREMSGAERLAIALDLHEFSCAIAREGIRAQHPEADENEAERWLHQRISLAPAVDKLVEIFNDGRTRMTRLGYEPVWKDWDAVLTT